jgi:hypothetical protein
MQTLYQQGKLTNRIWINFLHLESDPNTPELLARLLNNFPNHGDDMFRVLGIGEFTVGQAVGSAQWVNGARMVAQAGWRN